jgi:predicted deacetylase
MTARYLIRFDDVCPTMNWHVWDQIERVMVDLSVAPILAVVPDNRDPKLCVGPSRSDFWSRVREWQARGWTIGLHGFQHEYVNNEAGLIGINARSEFAGLSLTEQERKIGEALAIFAAHGVRADTWVAPAHSFDGTTLSVLRRNGINSVSDGFFLGAVRWHDMIWVPQQLWRFSRFPVGVWTICQHINSYGQPQIDSLRSDLARYQAQMITFRAAQQMARPFLITDALMSRAWLGALRVKRASRAWRAPRKDLTQRQSVGGKD